MPEITGANRFAAPIIMLKPMITPFTNFSKLCSADDANSKNAAAELIANSLAPPSVAMRLCEKVVRLLATNSIAGASAAVN